MTARLLAAALALACTLGVAALTTNLEPTYCQGSGCPPLYGNSNKGFPRDTQVAVNTSGIPTTMQDAQGNPVDCQHNGQQVNPRAVIEEALGDMTMWNSGNRSKIQYLGAGASTTNTINFVLGPVNMANGQPTTAGWENAVYTQSGGANYVKSFDVRMDLANSQSPATYPANTPWFDCSDPAEMKKHIKRMVFHELLHAQGVDNKPSGDVVPGETLMANPYPRNDHYPGQNPRMAADLTTKADGQPNNCDLNAVNGTYPPPPFEEEPQYWYDMCSIGESEYNACLNQQDAHEYDFNDCDCVLTVSPIVIDFGRPAFGFTNPEGGVVFDLRADGAPLQTAWTDVDAEDAFLVLDRNQNGLIDNGHELFGNYTAQPTPPPGVQRNGFRALAVYDRNNDRQITRADPVFDRLRLWFDLNHDGVSQPEEQQTLASRRITAISLNYRLSRRYDEFGNVMKFLSHVDLYGPIPRRPVVDVFFRAVRQ